MTYIKSALEGTTRLLKTVTIAFVCLSIPIASADDVEIYEHGGCSVKETYRFIFIVDNSGSMDSNEFVNSKGTIDASIRHVLNSGLEDIKVAVVQYGTGAGNGTATHHDYRVTVPFTDNQSVATNWSRDFGTGGNYRPSYYQDHQPGSLARMRLDGVYAAGGALDVSDATNVQFVFFTDAERDYSAGCCSSIVADAGGFISSDVMRGFGEYNALKNGSVLPNDLEAQFTLLHEAPGQAAIAAGAAIASVGGDYTGPVENRGGDPDGPGVKPRRYILGDLSVADTSKVVDLLDTVFEEIRGASTLSSPSVSTSDYNATRNSDRLYYSLFQPGEKKSWIGNIKGYRVNAEGVVVDAKGDPAADSESGTLRVDSRSYWSTENDGADVGSGGFASRLVTPRKWYTDTGTSLKQVSSVADLTLTELGVSSNAQRNQAIAWALGVDTVDLDEDNNVTEANRFVADSLHAGPMLVNYSRVVSGGNVRSTDVLFATSNQGMLHAINPKTGDEHWAYMPSELLPNLLDASKDRADINDHSYGLDGPLSFYKIDKPATDTTTGLAKGLLYLSQRRGGQNIVALDVTRAHRALNPFTFAWRIEGGSGDFIDLGQTWSKPEIITVNMNCDSATGCVSKDVLLFSGGYNPDYDSLDYGYPTTPAHPGHGHVIYIVDPLNGRLLWSAGRRNTNDLNLDMRDSIPSSPVTVDSDGDGGIDIIFSVDIAGKIWRIDLDRNATSFSNLHIAGGLIADLKVGGAVKQRFFNKLDVVMSRSGSSAAHFNLVVGSGMRSSPLTDETGRNSVYFVRDPWVRRNPVRLDSSSGELKPDYRYVTANGSKKHIERGDLIKVSESEGVSNFPTYGFYEDLTATGEKVLAPTVTVGGMTLLVTYVPPTEAPADDKSCTYTLGESRLRVYDMDNHKFVPIKENGEEHIVISPGIVSEIVLIDTGNGGLTLLAGLESFNLDDLITKDPTKVVNIRRIERTSWIETEKPK